MESLTKQVDKEAYNFGRYGNESRFVSYARQLKEIARAKPSTMLEIGVGDGTIGHLVKTHSPISYTSVDLADDVGADYVASVTKLPFKDSSYDLVCAFEVLEHVPFDQFDTALSEIARVTNRAALVSLPHFGPPVMFSLKVPFLPDMRIAFKLPVPLVHTFDGQHYWEIGKRGYSRTKVRSHIARYFTIEQEYVPFNNQYHRFFVLTKKS